MTEGTGREDQLYRQRFDPSEQRVRDAVWQVLGRKFFQKYIHPQEILVDIGAGDGLLLKNVQARRRIALDISPHALQLRDFGIEVIQAPATELARHLGEPADVIVMSNFLEHLPDKRVLLEVLSAAREALSSRGRLLILQPNIRYAGAAYWDYIDHHIALTEHSLEEALLVSGFRIQELIPRFLPYSAKSSQGRIAAMLNPGWMMEVYLRFPLAWKIFGAQTFVVATPDR